ncbi:colicin transporter [Epibacterium ulvae]|uniref:colicin transporter n=1 Tax=Epibacterium ulvae TaxID=1156985 RepID=UPI002491C161|nr:colicin transporter [Epibacterium ulvae]
MDTGQTETHEADAGLAQLEALQARITTALARIGSGVEGLENAAVAAAASAQNTELEQALDEEKMANAQLEERLKTLRGRLTAAESAAAPTPVSDPKKDEEIAALQAEVQLLRNEIGNAANSSAQEALTEEVKRLKIELEGARNGAASQKDQIVSLEGEIASLVRQLEELEQAEAEDTSAAVDLAALEAENTRLKSEAEALQHALAAAQSEVAAMPDLTALDAQLQSLRAINEQLVQSNAALRAANAEGVADTDLINKSMEAELEGQRAARATDKVEMEAVLARLEPLLTGATPAATAPQQEVV